MRERDAEIVSVEEAAIGLGVSPRTVRRWLQEQRLAGRKIGGTWGVVWTTSSVGEAGQTVTVGRLSHLRQRLRHLGERLMTLGNQAAGARRRRGQVFLTWRRARSLHLVFAIGRRHPLQGWAPHALGTDLPFWLKERARWQTVLPLLRRYERLRQWCHARLLRVPGVDAVITQELEQLEAALEGLALLVEALPPPAQRMAGRVKRRETLPLSQGS